MFNIHRLSTLELKYRALNIILYYIKYHYAKFYIEYMLEEDFLLQK